MLSLWHFPVWGTPSPPLQSVLGALQSVWTSNRLQSARDIGETCLLENTRNELPDLAHCYSTVLPSLKVFAAKCSETCPQWWSWWRWWRCWWCWWCWALRWRPSLGRGPTSATTSHTTSSSPAPAPTTTPATSASTWTTTWGHSVRRSVARLEQSKQLLDITGSHQDLLLVTHLTREGDQAGYRRKYSNGTNNESWQTFPPSIMSHSGSWRETIVTGSFDTWHSLTSVSVTRILRYDQYTNWL